MQLAGTMAAICQLKALSASGRCRTFDVAADGYGRGEGVTVMLLRPPGAGGSSGLPIIVAGSAVNQVTQLDACQLLTPDSDACLSPFAFFCTQQLQARGYHHEGSHKFTHEIHTEHPLLVPGWPLKRADGAQRPRTVRAHLSCARIRSGRRGPGGLRERARHRCPPYHMQPFAAHSWAFASLPVELMHVAGKHARLPHGTWSVIPQPCMDQG